MQNVEKWQFEGSETRLKHAEFNTLTVQEGQRPLNTLAIARHIPDTAAASPIPSPTSRHTTLRPKIAPSAKPHPNKRAIIHQCTSPNAPSSAMGSCLRRDVPDLHLFHPDNHMNLEPGRVEKMVQEATANESCIPCHSEGEAVCRGFFERHATAPLQIAQRLAFIVFQSLE